MAFTGYPFLVVPPTTAQPLTEIIEGQNDAADKNRFNVVFMRADGFYNQWDETDLGDLEMRMEGIEEMIIGKFGLFNVEPLKSNQDKFNFWYCEEDATYAYSVDSYELLYGDEYTLNDMSDYQKLIQGISLPNMITVQVEAEEYSGGKTCNAGGATNINIGFPKGDIQKCLEIEDMSVESCVDEQKLSRILTHELGHIIAYLPEEYEDKDGVDNPDKELKNNGQKYLYNLGPGGDTAIFTGKINEEDCVQPDTDTNGETCTPNPEAIDYCMNNARWKDLIGNGCGKDGIVDCTEADPLFRTEVSCSYAGAGYPKAYLSAHTTKSTKTSIMEDRYHFFDQWSDNGTIPIDVKNYDLYDGRFYGQVNERQLCRYMALRTDSVGGICGELCLDGCQEGQKCIEGTCKDSSEIEK